MSQDKSFFDTFEVIHTYTRKQAITDGVLVDMTQDKFGELLKKTGYLHHTAMTATAFAKVISDPDAPAEDLDAVGRWHNVLTAMKAAIMDSIRRSPSVSVDRVPFAVRVWDGRLNGLVNLYVHCGGGDKAEPVLTIMLEGED